MSGSDGLLDEPTSVRPGQELDPTKLLPLLRRELGLEGAIQVRQFPSGYSSLTYSLDIGDRQLVLRRAPPGATFQGAHDMVREHRMLAAVHPEYPLCPRPLFLCEDETVIGGSFYVMGRARGVILRRDIPPGLAFDAATMRALSRNVVSALADLHAIDAGRTGLLARARPDGYVRRQVEGWSRRYRAARTKDAPSFEAVMAWLESNLPPDAKRPAIVHNDFKLDNVVLDPDDLARVTAVLDWEMATIGHPLMDLGNSLAYWVEAADLPAAEAYRMVSTNAAGCLTRAEVERHYTDRTAAPLENMEFFFCFGLFRLAGIAQQIYRRFGEGRADDPRFAALVHGVRALEKRASRTAGLR